VVGSWEVVGGAMWGGAGLSSPQSTSLSDFAAVVSGTGKRMSVSCGGVDLQGGVRGWGGGMATPVGGGFSRA
jgi:hypothetical protein